MLHFVLQSLDGEPLFVTWEEGLALWWAIVSRTPGLVACFVMPDHVHVLIDRDVWHELVVAMRTYARWRNAHRGERGPVWRRLSRPEVVRPDKLARVDRYIQLNGCRGGLVADPLAWPLSTYRDAVGLAVRPVRPRVRDPEGYHRYVSGDPTVSVAGTELPAWPVLQRHRVDLAAVGEAVSAVMRAPEAALRRRGPARALFVRAARSLTTAPTDAIAAHADLGRRAVQAVAPSEDPDVHLVARVLGDPRFYGLASHDLRRGRGWRSWERHRRRPRRES